MNRVFQETGKARQKKTEELRAKGSSDLEALLAGNPGQYILEIPAEKVVQESREFWRGGGTLLVEVKKDKKILPLDSSGSIEYVIEEIKAIIKSNPKISFECSTLSLEEPPKIKMNGIKVNGIDEQKKLRLFWHLLKRAIRYQKVKSEFLSRATVSAEEFLLKGRTGICFVDKDKECWVNKDGSTIPNFFFLVERREKKRRKRRNGKNNPPCRYSRASQGILRSQSLSGVPSKK